MSPGMHTERAFEDAVYELVQEHGWHPGPAELAAGAGHRHRRAAAVRRRARSSRRGTTSSSATAATRHGAAAVRPARRVRDRQPRRPRRAAAGGEGPGRADRAGLLPPRPHPRRGRDEGVPRATCSPSPGSCTSPRSTRTSPSTWRCSSTGCPSRRSSSRTRTPGRASTTPSRSTGPRRPTTCSSPSGPSCTSPSTPTAAFVATRLTGKDTQFLPFNVGTNGPGNSGGAGNPPAAPGGTRWRTCGSRSGSGTTGWRSCSGSSMSRRRRRWAPRRTRTRRRGSSRGSTSGTPCRSWSTTPSGTAPGTAIWSSTPRARGSPTPSPGWRTGCPTCSTPTTSRCSTRPSSSPTGPSSTGSCSARSTSSTTPPASSRRSTRTRRSSRRRSTDSTSKIVITTLQMYPYVLDKIAGADLRGHRYAVIIDEAHTSQGGEAAIAAQGGHRRQRSACRRRGRGHLPHPRAGQAAQPVVLRVHGHPEVGDAEAVRHPDPSSATRRRASRSACRSTCTRCARPSRRATSSTSWPTTSPTRRSGGCATRPSRRSRSRGSTIPRSTSARPRRRWSASPQQHPTAKAQKAKLIVEDFRDNIAGAARRAGQGDGGHRQPQGRAGALPGHPQLRRQGVARLRRAGRVLRDAGGPGHGNRVDRGAAQRVPRDPPAGDVRLRQGRRPAGRRARPGRVPAAGRGREVPDGVRPAAAVRHVRRQEARRRRRGADAVAAQPHPPAQVPGRRAGARLRQLRGVDGGVVQALVRADDHRRGRPEHPLPHAAGGHAVRGGGRAGDGGLRDGGG